MSRLLHIFGGLKKRAAGAETPQNHAALEEMDDREKKILGITCLGHLLSHLNILVFPALLLPLTGFLNRDMATVLSYSFYMYLFYGLSALPWGMAADRIGARSVLMLFYIGCAGSALCAAVFIYSPVGLTLSLTGIGLFSGVYHPAALGWITKEIRRMSLAMGINGIFGSMGLAAAPIMAGVVNWLYNPRAVYFALAGVNVAGAVWLALAPASRKADGAAPVPKGPSNGSLKAFLILLVAMMFGGVVYRGATVTIPAYFELKNTDLFRWISTLFGEGISPNLVATTTASAIYLLGMIGQYVGGRTAEHFELRRSYFFFHAMTVPLALVMAATVDAILVFFTLAYFFFLTGMQPIENTLVAKFTPRRLISSAYGIKFVFTFGIGSVAVKMVEWVQAGYGIERVFTALALVSVLLVATIGVLIRNTPNLSGRADD